MITFELILNELYSAQLNYYDILTRAGKLEVYLYTNRGGVQYEITRVLDGERDLVSMRDNIAQALNIGSCWIKDLSERMCIYFGGFQYEGVRVKSDFLPN